MTRRHRGHSRALAIRAPSAIAFSLAQTTSSCPTREPRPCHDNPDSAASPLERKSRIMKPEEKHRGDVGRWVEQQRTNLVREDGEEVAHGRGGGRKVES